ncbi:MAG: glycosyltransferase [Ruminococcus sp.]|nr:glycosyltransferase [Ruminococcus sp.]
MKISFIVPVYNVEEFLDRCLESILAVKSVEWECILIDDGSTDSSWDIICGYEKKYPEKILARHKENGGVSSARNMGLDLASGDRIMFIDPDDYLFPEADGFFKKALNEYGDRDQILFKELNVYDDGRTEKGKEPKRECGDYNDMIFYNALISFWASLCRIQLFKTSIINKYGIRFDESMRVAEDLVFSLDYIKHSQNYIAFDEYIYAYYQRTDSAVNRHCEGDWRDYAKYISKCGEVTECRKMKLSKNQLRDMYFFQFKMIIRSFINAYCQLIPGEFKSKCREIFSIAEIKNVIDKSTKYMFIYICLKLKMYTVFHAEAKMFVLFKKIKERIKSLGR